MFSGATLTTNSSKHKSFFPFYSMICSLIELYRISQICNGLGFFYIGRGHIYAELDLQNVSPVWGPGLKAVACLYVHNVRYGPIWCHPLLPLPPPQTLYVRRKCSGCHRTLFNTGTGTVCRGGGGGEGRRWNQDRKEREGMQSDCPSVCVLTCIQRELRGGVQYRSSFFMPF